MEANLVRLNEEFQLPYVADLVERKRTQGEKATLPDADMAFHQREYERLREELRFVAANSRLPEIPSASPALNDLLVRLRSASPLSG